MQKAASPDTLAVAGDKLKQAREARGMSVPDMAGAVTLSREQVRALEDGGNLPFYTADHKRLALKKYAAALGIPLSELIVDAAAAQDASAASAAPEALPASPVPVPASATPADLRLATAERNARLRRQLLATAVAGAILLALYAKQRGTIEPEPPSVAADAAAADAPPEPLEPLKPLVPAGAAAAAVAQEPAAPAAPATAAAAAQAGSEPCSLPAAADVAAWSPPYQRKPDARLFLISSKAVDVCVADASGKPVLVSLKPNAGHAFSGKPPYLVRADGLSAIELYLQGMRVRVPAGAQALRLLPTSVTPPPDVAASPAAE